MMRVCLLLSAVVAVGFGCVVSFPVTCPDNDPSYCADDEVCSNGVCVTSAARIAPPSS